MSKYLTAFQSLKDAHKEKFYLVGDFLLVEEVKAEEIKTASGLFVSSGTTKMVDGIEANMPVFVRVLATGEGFYDDETGAPVPGTVSAGDIILVGKLSVGWFSTFGKLITVAADARLGITKEESIQMLFKGQDAYEQVFSFLNQQINGVK